MSLRSRPETLHVSSPQNNQWNAGTTILVPAVADRRVAVYSAALVGAATSYFAFQDDQAVNISAQYYVTQGIPFVIPQNQNMDPWFITGPGRGLAIYIAAAGAIAGDIYYLYVP